MGVTLFPHGEELFWRITMRPGRLRAFGRIADGAKTAYLFGLPGNPIAVRVTFYHFVRGALLHMRGATQIDLPLLQAKSQEAMRKKPGRTEYQRAFLATTAVNRRYCPAHSDCAWPSCAAYRAIVLH